MNEPFVKVPHWVSDFLETADMNMTQNRIFQVVLRQTFGFHQKSAPFSQSFLAKRTTCNQRQIARELKDLVQRRILLQFYKDGKRHLCINPALANEVHNQTPQDENSYDSLDTPDHDSSDIGRYDSSDIQIKKELKKEVKEKHYITLTSDAHIFIKIYLKHFEKMMKKKHPRISAANYAFIENQIDHLVSFDIDEAVWEEQVKYHLNNLPKNNNGSILPFLKASHRYFEVGVYDQFN
ncbi:MULTISPECIES: replication protein [unclassified Paenibacillus]|uniref:replication protein n=1 Tax=unclassified Paenibacillus TaxID=185978 RepID=UPI0030FCCB9E